MRTLNFDGGAERMGWAMMSRTAVVNGRPELYYHMSGLLSLAKGNKERYQDYRIRLITEVATSVPVLIEAWQPDIIVCEVLPANGFGSPFQAYLANVALTTVQVIAFQRGIPIDQISARTVQSKIAIRGKSKKITKVQVRNGVLALFPELEEYKHEWFITNSKGVKTPIFDEPDAIAIGAAYLGASNE
jgi:hypothetical protein